MTRRNYTNSASVGTIPAAINNTDTVTTSTLSASPSSWPSTPFTAALNLAASDEEVVLVTAVSGTSVTYTRGYNGTATRSHTGGATLTHASVAMDFDEANAHIQAATAVHGIAGSVVGTSDSQTLTNKTITSPVVGDFTNANHDHSSTGQGGAIQQSSITGLVSALAAKAVDTGVLHLAGAETVTGAKNFTGGLQASGNTVTSAVSGGTKIQSGTIGATISSGNDWVAATVTFPTAFGSTPIVTATATGDASLSPQHITAIGIRTVSAASVTFHIQNVDDTTTARGYSINWIAVGS